MQFYTCPMHPEIEKESEGMCPECGMNLVKSETRSTKSETRTDHDKHAEHSTQMFLMKFWVSLLFTIPVVLYSGILSELFSWEAPAFPGSFLVPAIFGTAVFFYGGWVFLASAWRELRARMPGMMTLIALAITAAYAWSVVVVLGGGKDTLFWELTTLITIMLLGHWIEMRAVSSAQGALKALSKLLPDTAEVVRDGATEIIALADLQEGMEVLVRPGGRIPADGMVREGEADVNEAMITGESAPVAKKEGSEVIAGTMNGDGALRVRVTKVGEHTFLAGVMRLVQEAQASKSRLQLLSDRAAFYLTVIAVSLGTLTFLVWFFVKADVGFALERLVAVLVIACPHALGLAVPLVAAISTTLAARNGFLVRKRLALEFARKIDVVLFDKTGTLTRGEYGVAHIWIAAASDEKELLQIAASVDAQSEHFISRALLEEAKKRNIALSDVSGFTRLPGKGVSAELGGKKFFVGGFALREDFGASIPAHIQQEVDVENAAGKTIIYVLQGHTLLGILALADMVREESREAISVLKAMGVRVAMVTGDSENVARWVSDELGIDEFFAKVLPQQKAEKVKLLQERGMKVAMVGDGINDAPALTQADLGIAIGAGTNVAIESAGIILVRNDPRDIVKIIRLSRMTFSKMVQNLFWATGYNVIALPLAAGALAAQGIILQPALAALFMSASTVIVAANAMLLRRQRLG